MVVNGTDVLTACTPSCYIDIIVDGVHETLAKNCDSSASELDTATCKTNAGFWWHFQFVFFSCDRNNLISTVTVHNIFLSVKHFYYCIFFTICQFSFFSLFFFSWKFHAVLFEGVYKSLEKTDSVNIFLFAFCIYSPGEKSLAV